MKKYIRHIAILMALVLALSSCGGGGEGSSKPVDSSSEPLAEPPASSAPAQSQEEENPYTLEEMDMIKFNYYVELNNDLVDILDSMEYYFQVVDYQEEFSLLPDTGLTYGYRVSGKNTDIIEDCLYLADMEPSYGEMDQLVKDLAEPLAAVMEACSSISGSYDYADNQYQKAKEYHAAIYANVETVESLGYAFMDAVAAMGAERRAEEEEQMKADGRLIIYNASRAISIGKEILNVLYDQGVGDENINDMDLSQVRPLYDELVQVVADFDAATADNDQLIQESLSNSRPFDGLLDSLIQALDWMMKQAESGKVPDMSHSGAPLGSIAHVSETLSKCIERYNSVFVD